MVDKQKILNLGKGFVKSLFADDYECLNCGAERTDDKHFYLCKKCYNNIEFILNSCEKCGDRVGSFDHICESCKENYHFFNKAICVAKYEGVARNLVRKLKYDNCKYLAKALGLLMSEKLKKSEFFGQIDYVIAVPLFEKRINERGFNQSQLIAETIAKECSFKVLNNALKRVKNTPTQTSLSSEQRRKNVKNAFEVVEKTALKEANVLLVDDIITTGATLDEISRLLKRYNVKNIFAITFCHA